MRCRWIALIVVSVGALALRWGAHHAARGQEPGRERIGAHASIEALDRGAPQPKRTASEPLREPPPLAPTILGPSELPSGSAAVVGAPEKSAPAAEEPTAREARPDGEPVFEVPAGSTLEGGWLTLFDSQGRKEAEGPYVGGHREGLWSYYDTDGPSGGYSDGALIL